MVLPERGQKTGETASGRETRRAASADAAAGLPVRV
ncbi:protein of unknown function [Xenorhabdus nematophila AN6/1]|nr:protein of unknown function [Xenorhabdus nematophila AN6/1]